MTLYCKLKTPAVAAVAAAARKELGREEQKVIKLVTCVSIHHAMTAHTRMRVAATGQSGERSASYVRLN